MNYLIQGGESAERFKLLLSLTKIKEPITSALFDYYVKGVASGSVAELRGIKHGNVSRGADTLEERAAIVEAIKEIDWEKHLAKLAAANVRIVELEQLVSMAASYMNGNELLEQHLRAAISDSKEHAA